MSRNKELQDRSKEGKERKRARGRGKRKDTGRDFIMDGEGKAHYTRRPLGHLASELADTGRMDEAANLVRGLKAWAQRSTIGGEVIVDRFDHSEKASGNFTSTEYEIRHAVANRSAI